MDNLRQLFFRHVAQTSASPLALEIVKAKGTRLTDAEGKEYLDLISGISVSNLGHNNSTINEAIKRQLDEYSYLMVYGEFIQSAQVLLANKIASFLPQSLSSVYFVTTGAEATEGAVKLSKRHTARPEIISFENAYHGSTQGALSVGGNEELKNSFRPLIPGTEVLPFNSIKDLDKITTKTAVVIIEPIQGEAGIRVADKEFLSQLRKRCHETGTLLIFDEIQTGMGRTGKLFAFEHYNIVPDILLLGKALGGGMPLSAFISSDNIMSSLSYDPVLGHITTFGGHPLSCAGAIAAFDILTSTNLIPEAVVKEQIFRKYLNHRLIKEIRGKGLILSLQFENEEVNRLAINNCIKKGVLVDWFLFAPDCMRIAPPLTVTEQEIIHACSVIVKSLVNLS
jgi:acetylornithine/N-succinyldiaminopimelate aminotransferase